MTIDPISKIVYGYQLDGSRSTGVPVKRKQDTGGLNKHLGGLPTISNRYNQKSSAQVKVLSSSEYVTQQQTL